MSSPKRTPTFECVHTLSNVMFKEVLLFLALACLGVAEDVRFGYLTDELFLRQLYPQEKILGGEDANLGEFPYHVSVIHWALPFYFFCGGAILSETVVLTVAHCVKNKDPELRKPATVTAGSVSMKDPGPQVQVSSVRRAVIHPKFDPESYRVQSYDIAVLFLHTPFSFNKNVQPAALPEPGATFDGKAMLTGWGSISTNSTHVVPDALQKVELSLIDYDECRKKITSPVMTEFGNVCTSAYGPDGEILSPCMGDSGGPLTKNIDGRHTIVGVVSWGVLPCGLGFPFVYTRVSSYVDFINTVIAHADNLSAR